ncbi:hypothetical protein Aglo03_02350 [Actinokineospora globicatena]|uniref:ABC3 transporter permease C-terminal domain-containing protein n=1 Tax=Actinokineospora globicatena TaxID=103729 RepID=A0A9W6V6X8_9PSEU|nr:hypothetical protein Aglo03_02350 [Actinokineospora globicatena]
MLAIAACVGLVLVAVSALAALWDSSARQAARQPLVGEQSGVSSLGLTDTSVLVGDLVVSGRWVTGDGPAPPGLTRLPGPGELVVSPALARLLSDEPAALARFSGARIGVITPDGLAADGELYFYQGVAGPTSGGAVHGFGGARLLEPGSVLAIALITAVLLAPLLLFTAGVARLGVIGRDHLLATLRLLGADSGQVRQVAVAEPLLGAVLGLVLGIAAFAAVVPDLRWIAVVPLPWSVIAAASAVLVALVVGAVLAGTRGVLTEPLGVVRQATPVRRQLWWRLVPLVAGAAQLGAVTTGLATDILLIVLIVPAGVLCLVLAVPALLPWLVERFVAGLRGGPPSWHLAVRRLQFDTATPSRVVSGIAVVLAGAIAVRTLTSSLAGRGQFRELDTAVALLAAFTLVVAGTSLLVLVVHHLVERERAVAALSATGVPGRVVALSLLWQNLLPMGIGVVLADLAGVGAGAVVAHRFDAPTAVDWAFVGAVDGAGVGVVLVATALSLPVLRASADVRGLRDR